MVITSHSLVSLVTRDKQASARIKRWKLRLMPYDCKLVYRLGRKQENKSRHPSSKPVEQNVAEDYVHFVCNNAVPKAMTLEEIKQATKEAVELQAVVKAVETDQWRSPDVQRYKQLKEEILVFNGLVLRANSFIIPTSLRNKAVDLAHQGHQGMVKTKQLIRDKVWFPGIENLVEEKVKNCLSCQVPQ